MLLLNLPWIIIINDENATKIIEDKLSMFDVGKSVVKSHLRKNKQNTKKNKKNINEKV